MGAIGNQVKSGVPSNYLSDGAIGKYRIVKFGSADANVALAVDGASPIRGITGDLGVVEAGKRIDVYTDKTQRVYYGGTVAAGDRLTADANGAAIATTTAGAHIVGRAAVSGVAGDIGTAEINPDIY